MTTTILPTYFICNCACIHHIHVHTCTCNEGIAIHVHVGDHQYAACRPQTPSTSTQTLS